MQQYDQKIMNLRNYNLSPPKPRLRKGQYSRNINVEDTGAMEDLLGVNNSMPTIDLVGKSSNDASTYGLGG